MGSVTPLRFQRLTASRPSVCDLTLRHQGNVEDSTLVNYMSFQDLVDYIIGAMPPYPEQDLDPYDLFVNHPCPVLQMEKIVVFDPCGGNTGTGGWISRRIGNRETERRLVTLRNRRRKSDGKKSI